MKQTIQLLMVDDHPFILSAYKNTVDRFQPETYSVIHTEAAGAEAAYEAIFGSVPFDVAFLDISLPPYPEKNIFSGLDLAKLLNEKMPSCKVVLLTMHTEQLKFQEVIDTINPAGLIVKNDLTFEELLTAFDQILQNNIYYSESVIKMMEENNATPT